MDFALWSILNMQICKVENRSMSYFYECDFHIIGSENAVQNPGEHVEIYPSNDSGYVEYNM